VHQRFGGISQCTDLNTSCLNAQNSCWLAGQGGNSLLKAEFVVFYQLQSQWQ
jgi:hypothetical protein